MTEQEKAAIEAKQAVRAAVVARWSDGSATIAEEDCKHLGGEKIKQLINARRIEGAGLDKRLGDLLLAQVPGHVLGGELRTHCDGHSGV